MRTKESSKHFVLIFTISFLNIGFSTQQAIISGLQNIAFTAGGTGYLTVQIDASISEAGVWRKDGTQLSRVKDKLIFPLSTGYRQLVRYSWTTEDEGQYTFSINGETTSAYVSISGTGIVNGQWSSWGPWADIGTCLATCGSSATNSRRRNRACNNPAPKNGGETCAGQSEDTETFYCGQGGCLVNGGWSEWSPWSSVFCDVSCGSFGQGTRTKYRYCTNPSPQNGGRYCQGVNLETSFSPCVNLPSCIGTWSEWGPWGPPSCAETCGTSATGSRRRTRTCLSGGCPGSSFQEEEASCGLPPCSIFTLTLTNQSVEAGSYAYFSVRTSQTGLSGTWYKDGVRVESSGRINIQTSNNFHILTVRDLQSSDQGLYMFRLNGESTTAYLTVTSGTGIVNGQWSSWGQWADVGTCLATCGSSTTNSRRRNRACNSPAPQNGGETCAGRSEDTETFYCGQGGCPINGGWSEWTAWGRVNCPVTCGSNVQGTRAKYRNCTNPAPSNGGSECSGVDSLTEFSPCVELSSCLGFEQELVDTAVRTGVVHVLTVRTTQAGITGTWYKNEIQLYNSDRIQIVSEGTVHNLTISRVLLSDEGRYTFTANDYSTSAYIRISEMLWSEWNPWSVSACSVTCETGEVTLTRRRICQGGSSCQGLSEERNTQKCSLPACTESESSAWDREKWLILALGAAIIIGLALLIVIIVCCIRQCRTDEDKIPSSNGWEIDDRNGHDYLPRGKYNDPQLNGSRY